MGLGEFESVEQTPLLEFYPFPPFYRRPPGNVLPCFIESRRFSYSLHQCSSQVLWQESWVRRRRRATASLLALAAQYTFDSATRRNLG